MVAIRERAGRRESANRRDRADGGLGRLERATRRKTATRWETRGERAEGD